METAIKPTLAIIIPMYNAAEHIELCLDHLLQSDYPNFQIMVVDDCSKDESKQKVAAYANVQLVAFDKNRGVSAARNQGAMQSKADYLLFLDSDVLVGPKVLSSLMACFNKYPEVAIVQGRYADHSYYPNLFSQYKHYIFSYRGLRPTADAGPYSNYVHTACVAMGRKVMERIQFNEKMCRGEDIDFGQRCAQAGILIYSDPHSTVDNMKYYSLRTFSRYQFKAAFDLADQVLNKRSDNAETPFYGKKNPLYKKLWLLRPVVSGLMLLNLLWLLFFPSPFAWGGAALLLAVSTLLELGFRAYLWRVAPYRISIAAFFLYFYDGILVMMGVTWAVVTAAGKKILGMGHE